jgi:hypothetical protein
MILGGEVFLARLEVAAAPATCAVFRARLPYEASVIHARWSGEALWIPTGEHPGAPEPENLIERPEAGQILWYGGGLSEPEVLIPYGSACFACSQGPLSGNHFLTLTEGRRRLAQAGQAVLWTGARKIRFEAA